MDVEGGELSVLEGASNILKQGKTVFLIELHRYSGIIDPGDVFKLMGRHGYFPKNISGRMLFSRSSEHILKQKIRFFRYLITSFLRNFCISKK
jgi:hypothetical protein